MRDQGVKCLPQQASAAWPPVPQPHMAVLVCCAIHLCQSQSQHMRKPHTHSNYICATRCHLTLSTIAELPNKSTCGWRLCREGVPLPITSSQMFLWSRLRVAASASIDLSREKAYRGKTDGFSVKTQHCSSSRWIRQVALANWKTPNCWNENLQKTSIWHHMKMHAVLSAGPGIGLGAKKKKKKHATFSPFLDVTMGRHVPNVTMKGFGACFQCHDAACAGSGAGLLARNRMDQKVWGLPVLDFLFKC